ncbi:Eco57I restriction-modification methylase domain-containing protein [Kurthia sibirica]|uniref:site-specific DNA-methyltransferase (adenine-specific) n=1 Tax=Kurthia sibirica TaxID=202750 RepID=A0A2U3AKB0_9BACL|nr:DNA methyltransferase [Kurthia sibirica]PWI24976.1 restriction endonuclease subunit M [Kurthia sibirica]GEK33118.1 restriction endonuclease subunit M [Kurthia sibirica]
MELEQLVRNFKKNYLFMKDNKKKYNEHSTRVEYIDPFFQLLGWDVSNTNGKQPSLRDVIPESYTTATLRPDYKFSVNGISKFFLEAKKPSVNITTDLNAIFQTRSYGWSKKHYISVLTNFEYLLIFDATVAPTVSDNEKTGLLKVYHYEEYISKWDEIKELLSYENVRNGNIENEFSHLIEQASASPIDEHFLHLINSWRISIANDIYAKDKSLSETYLNEIIQRFINQMIFLRICEDKNLPLYHSLEGSLDKNVKSKLMDIIKDADKKYNSGIFEDSEILELIEGDTLTEIIKSLYYPVSPYAFSILEPNILGEIYELFLTEKITIKENSICLTKKHSSINRDIVTTPYEIVKLMVDKALSPYCENKSAEEILNLKIADISCGSGIFLIEVFDYLLIKVQQWYIEHNPNQLVEAANGEKVLSIDLKINVLNECIYGIDIDAYAVEVSKFSLMLKLLDGEDVHSLENRNYILPVLDENIKVGNALIDSDMYGTDEEMEKRLNIYPFDWNFSNSDVEEFDLIIGNPPYVTTEDMKGQLLKEEYELYKSYYSSAYKQFDKYFIFIERAIEHLKEDGSLVYIIPNKFTKIESGKKLRELITNKKLLKEYIDFGSLQLFRGTSKNTKHLTTYSSIIHLKKDSESHFNYEKVSNKQNWLNEYFEKVIDNSYKIALDSLGEKPWVLPTSESEQVLLEKILKKSLALNEVADIFNGIQTSAERPPVYWFADNEIVKETPTHYSISKMDKIFEIEKNIVRPFYKPTKKSEKNLGSYDVVETNKHMIFPYDISGKIYSQEKMQSDFNGTWEYLESNYEKLVPKQVSPNGKRDVPHATSESWYHYGRIQALTRFIDRPKLIVGVLSSKPFYYLDNEDMLIASGGTAGYCAISQKENSDYAIEFLQAVLSHPLIEWVISMTASEFDNGFYARGTALLRNLPIVKIDFENKDDLEKYTNIVNLSREIYTLNNKLSNKLDSKTKKILEGDKFSKIKKIQAIVWKLYEVTEDEI